MTTVWTDLDYTSVVDLEFELFRKVQNLGGEAACQREKRTFYIMRYSQLYSWTPAIVRSYYRDLQEAQAQGRNLFADKYAYMMEQTHPLKFSALKDRLPTPSAEAEQRIEEMCAIVVVWALEMKEKYPAFMRQGRKIRSAEDNFTETSIETYTRGELKTYSPETLALLHQYYKKCQAFKVNVQEQADTFMAKGYGYAALAEAEAKLVSAHDGS